MALRWLRHARAPTPATAEAMPTAARAMSGTAAGREGVRPRLRAQPCSRCVANVVSVRALSPRRAHLHGQTREVSGDPPDRVARRHPRGFDPRPREGSDVRHVVGIDRAHARATRRSRRRPAASSVLTS